MKLITCVYTWVSKVVQGYFINKEQLFHDILFFYFYTDDETQQ